jgi:hypothetical protein
MAKGRRSTQGERAALQYSAWRDQGTPGVVTGHEAWKLTNGLVGKESDNETRINLSLVAVSATK